MMPDLLKRFTDFATRNLHEDSKPEFPTSTPEVKKPPKPPKPVVTPPEVTTPATPVAPAVVANVELTKFLQRIRAMEGTKYCSPPSPALYAKPRCTDCSGGIAWAFFQATGRAIPGNGGSHEQFNQAGRMLARPTAGKPGEEWLPGDLLFYMTTGERRAGNYASHVGTYLGNGKAIHGMNPNQNWVILPTNTQYWNSRFLGAKRLWEATPQPKPQPGGEWQPVTPEAGPITPAAKPPITFATPYRSISGVSAEQWEQFLTDAESPMAAEAASIAAVTGPLLAVAGPQSFKESQYGKAAAGNNPLGLMELNGSTLKTYPTWTAAFQDWVNRQTDKNYKGGVYMPRDMTLEQFIVIYVGGPECWTSKGARCANGETWSPGGGPDDGSVNLYMYQTKARINRYLGKYDPDPLWPDFVDDDGNEAPAGDYVAWKIEGTSKRLYLPKGVPFNVCLTPAWRTCNRSGYKLNWSGMRQHETGNTGANTGARMHACEWQFNGTPGHPDGCVAVHFYVDMYGVWQALPINEQGIHSGDAGNQTQVAIELAVPSNYDYAAGVENAAHLEAGLLYIGGMTPEEDMWMHHQNSGCPPGLRKIWPEFERKVRRNLDAIMRAI